MVKTIKDIFLSIRKADGHETWNTALNTQVLPSVFKCCPWVDLNLFYGKVKTGPLCFCMGKVKTMDFSETIVVYDIKVGRCSQLNESFISTKDQGHSLIFVKITQIQCF